MFPRIERTCPYLDRLDSVMDGDFCRMCKREVHDLTDMDRAERAAFLDACNGDACVRYTAWVKPALAAAMIAASTATLAAPAMAQDRGGKPSPQVRKPGLRHVRTVKRVKPISLPLVAVTLAGAPPPPPIPTPTPSADAATPPAPPAKP